jgi:hypothetical protein
LSDSAASTVEQMYRHLIVFGKSGKHRANTLAAPVEFRDGHPVLRQNIGSPIKTKKEMVIEPFWFLHLPHYRSFCDRRCNVGTSPRYSSLERVDLFRTDCRVVPGSPIPCQLAGVSLRDGSKTRSTGSLLDSYCAPTSLRLQARRSRWRRLD